MESWGHLDDRKLLSILNPQDLVQRQGYCMYSLNTQTCGLFLDLEVELSVNPKYYSSKGLQRLYNVPSLPLLY